MMKQKLFILLVTLLSTMTAWAEVGEPVTAGNLKYKITSEETKTLELVGYEGEKPVGSLEIPATVDVMGKDYYVTGIGEKAFYHCPELTSIKIPVGVTTIGKEAFRYTSLKSAIIPDGVTSIGQWVFANNDNLESVSIPGSLEVISAYAFRYCHSITSVTISNGVKRIQPNVFQDCNMLISIEIPISVTFIMRDAFKGCTSMTDVYCNVVDPDNLEWDEDGCDDFKTDGSTRCHVTCDVTAWEEKFGGVVNVKFVCSDSDHAWGEWSVTEPTCTENGGEKRVCSRCGKIEYGELIPALGHNWSGWVETTPPTCTEFGTETNTCARCGETSVEEIFPLGHDFNEDSECKRCHIDASEMAVDDLFTNNNLIYQITSVSPKEVSVYWYVEKPTGALEIPATVFGYSVTSIDMETFYNCKDLTSVTIPNTVTSIGKSAFEYCI